MCSLLFIRDNPLRKARDRAVEIRASSSRAYMRAPSNSDFVFLLSQVSHTKKKLVEKQPFLETIKAKKLPNVIVFSGVFSTLETPIC